MKSSNLGQQPLFIMSRNELENLLETSFRRIISQIRSEQELLTKTFTRAEAASFLKITPQTLSTYVSKGLLNPATPGRKMVFTSEQLINFINSNQANRWEM